MSKRIYLYISVLVAILFLTGNNKLWSAPDKSIIYQGTLRKDGKVITGNVKMEFKIVDGSGTEYWTSGSTVVYVNRGLFRYQIGIDNKDVFNSIPWGDITPYISVKITDEIIGDITFPEEGFSWTPYAMYADNVVGGALVNSTQTFTGINTFDNIVNINKELRVGKSTISSEGWITLEILTTEPLPSEGRIYYSGTDKKLKISLDGVNYVNIATGTIKEGLGHDVVYSTNIANGEVKDEDVTLTTGAIKWGRFDDNRITITTGAITSGKFNDDRILITTGAISSGIFSDDRISISTGAIVSGKFSDDRIAITTEAITSGKFNDNRISITTGAITSGIFGDDRIFITTRAISGVGALATKDNITENDIIGTISDNKLNKITTADKVSPSAISAGGLPSNIYISSINSGNYLNDVKVSSAIYSDRAGISESLSGNINANQINAGILATNVIASSIALNSVGSYQIIDSTITDADISANAAIAYSKLNIADGDLTIAKTNGLQEQLNNIATSTNNIQGQITNLNTS
ncbi:MAG: hypothetical protein GX445_07240, partial [Elusimicrobia bacterium]|nr:hypothetical protein [Elusimicrobiota bacterium]